MATWLYGEQFVSYKDEDLVGFWNDGDGSISWRRDLQAELGRRGYDCRTTDAHDPRPRIRGGEQLVLTVREGREGRTGA